MLRTALVTALLAGLGTTTAMAGDHLSVSVAGGGSGGYVRIDDHWGGHGDHWESDHRGWDRGDWDRRGWDHRDWARRDWERRQWERREWERSHWAGPGWGRRYWDDRRGWVVIAPGPAPYYGWHWDAYLGRWCP